MKDIGTMQKSLLNIALAIAVAATVGLAMFAGSIPRSQAATQAETGPPPPGLQEATFAAGCFWSMQAIFEELKGVLKVEPGYAGGTLPHPSYERVEEGDTGYAESINIYFDPKVISYRQLLQVLLIARDPTTLNQQGPDAGTQYRSVIFYHNAAQKKAAQEAVRQVNASHVWKDAIVTEVTPFTTFYRAEDYHFDYYKHHPDQPYCRFVIAPEIAKFREKFASELK
jgi:peptide-methionine (S)-S-oxide reductase